MTLKTRIQDWDEPVVLFEMIPPFAGADAASLRTRAEFVRRLLADHPIDALNIPEVRDETRGGERPKAWKPVMDPRVFGEALRSAIGPSTEILINHPTVYEPPEAFDAWLQETVARGGFHNLVFVGGESSKVAYLGPSPAEATRAAQARHPERLLVGGITIPSRRRPGPGDEVQRLLAKSEAGMSFFTSQILYEADSAKFLLRDYAAACAERGVRPRPIFLSFGPIKAEKDIRFLEWLGVEIPASVRREVLRSGELVLERSIDVLTHLFEDILAYVTRRKLNVPIGLNIEHIMASNLEPSLGLTRALTELMRADRRAARVG